MPEKVLALSKMLGGLSGNFVAMAIIKPKTVMDAVGRLFTSVVLAYYLTTPAASYFFEDPPIETSMAIAMCIGLFGWFVVSIIIRTVNSAKNIKELKEKL